MIYYEVDGLCIRTMLESDIKRLYDGFFEQNWNKPYEQFSEYYIQQKNEEKVVIVAEKQGEIAGYVTLLLCAKEGPFANKDIPEIVDFNVFIKFQKNGIGNKILDVTEALAKAKSKYVSL